jgi:formylglycine-generating enzyme required for sulfatase activity
LKRTCKVGSYEPNQLGLYDMHGNVWESCDDEQEDANEAVSRVHRGGCWADPAVGCAAAYRGLRPSHRNIYLGLRLARVRVGKES